jgi:hypothetical protein
MKFLRPAHGSRGRKSDEESGLSDDRFPQPTCVCAGMVGNEKAQDAECCVFL